MEGALGGGLSEEVTLQLRSKEMEGGRDDHSSQGPVLVAGRGILCL